MSSEFDIAEEPKDRTAWLWFGICLAVCLMALIIFLVGKPKKLTMSRVRAKHILISYDASDPEAAARARQQITSLRQRILDGEDFSKLARTYSMDPGSSSRGGDLGYETKGVFEKEFEEFVWAAPLNQLSDVIRTAVGYHLAIVVDRQLTDTDKYEVRIYKEVAEQEKQTTDVANGPAEASGDKSKTDP